MAGNKKRKRKSKILLFLELFLAALALGAAVWGYFQKQESPEELLTQYFEKANQGDYEGMYGLLCEESQEMYSLEEFITRNQNIYEGIGARSFQLTVKENKASGTGRRVSFQLSLDSDAGTLNMDNSAYFQKAGLGKYELYWEHSLIFPELHEDDRVEITEIPATRGSILDRNGLLMAGQGLADSVGLVPGKMETGKKRTQDLARLAELLEMEVEEIEDALSASWVKSNSFVPLKLLDKSSSLDLTAYLVGEGDPEPEKLQLQLLTIPGVLITETEARVYPFKEAASHLTGYVQSVTAEDLAEHEGEGYTQNSVIGRSGAELLYEETLRGIDGCKIVILDRNGREKQIVGAKRRKNGQDVTLTIDMTIQRGLYEQFADDKSASAAINPKTGEILALVSTPSFDANDFLRGMSQKQWETLTEDKDRPLENRFRAVFCPGSSFKPIVAGIGLTTGSLSSSEDFGNEGLSWQKDESWGDYYVTTLQAYEPVILSNALLYSDNIYFAKAALRIGETILETELGKMGFGERVPCDIWMSPSQVSNGEHIGSEILLADTGYGQGEVLVNPLHMAAIYSAFVNQGSMIETYLQKKETGETSFWKEKIFSESAVEFLNSALTQVIENPAGTGYPGYIEGLTLAGKTGTAEIKASQQDENGTELGWFAVYTPQGEGDQSICVVSMVEDVKERSGSTYVVKGVKAVLEQWMRSF